MEVRERPPAPIIIIITITIIIIIIIIIVIFLILIRMLILIILSLVQWVVCWRRMRFPESASWRLSGKANNDTSNNTTQGTTGVRVQPSQGRVRGVEVE